MDEKFLQPFCDTTQTVLKQMANINIIDKTGFTIEKDDMVTYGVVSIINFMGKIKGRLVIDMETELSLYLSSQILDEDFSNPKDKMVLFSVSEINNIIAGNSNTELNNKYSLNLRLSPPIVFTGKETILSIPKISSWTKQYITNYGQFKINIAFEGGIK